METHHTQYCVVRCVKSTEILYSSKSTFTLMTFYLSTSKVTHLKRRKKEEKDCQYDAYTEFDNIKRES